MIDLTVIWASIIGFAIIAYVVMDGFDLGIGILFPFFKVFLFLKKKSIHLH